MTQPALMNEHYLLDTNSVSAALSNNSLVIARIAQASTIAFPAIVVGELFFGAYHSARVEENLTLFESIAQHNTILDCDVATARVYGAIKARLREKGRPIPDNDIWIAALAIQHDLILLTRDAHFDAVEQAHVEHWQSAT